MRILDQVKDVAKLAREYGKIELYQKAVDLQSQVNDLAAENTELRQVVAEARQQVADLQEKLRLKGQVVFRHGVYFLKKEDGTEEGPFCTRCWDAERLLIRVDRNDNKYHCRHCDPHQRVKPPLPASLVHKPVGW